MLDASTLCRFVDSILFYLVISAKSSILPSRFPSKNTSRTLAKTSLGETLSNKVIVDLKPLYPFLISEKSEERRRSQTQ